MVFSITLDRYGQLMTWSENEAAELFAAYLEAQRAAAEEAAPMLRTAEI
jgi:hypothetical protein